MKQKRKFLAWLLLLALVFTSIPAIPASAENEADKVINVLDYGADPTGEADSTEAIWNALQAAKEAEADGSSVTLEFPEGEYHIYKDKAQKREYHTSNTNSIENPVKTIGFLVEEHENLTIDGNGSLFMMHGNMMALAVVKSKNITLKDFAWDFAVPTVVEMTVTKVEGNYTEYYIPDCFPHTVSGNTIKWSSDLSPYTGQPYWSGSGHTPDGKSTYGVVGYHPEDEMVRTYYPSDGPLGNVSRIEEIDENNVRVYYSNRSGDQVKNQKPGVVLEMCGNAHRETAGAFTWESENVTADGINVHFMHGFGWLIQMSKDVYYRNCNLAPRANSGHTTVSFADGIHASGAAGEIVIENCNFANTHDDPINMHGTFTRVESRRSDYELTLKYIHGQQGGFTQYHVGDKVQFFTRDTLESTDGEKQYTVAEVIQDADVDGRNMIVRFEEKLPENLSDRVSGQPKYVAENVTYAPAVTIKGCTFKNSSARGVLCTTRNKVVMEDNIFMNMSLATIFLSNDSNDWYESGPIRDMEIKNNIFYIKDIGRTSWATAPAIYIHPVTLGGGLPAASNPIHKNIKIEGNTFYMDLDRVVEAESVENLIFKNNKVYRMNPDVEIEIDLANKTISAGETSKLTTNATGNTNSGSVDNVFNFKKCKNVVIEGNTYDDGLKLCAVTDQDTIDNGLTVNDEDVKVVTYASAATEPVADIQYASTNPEVVKVDKDGNITGVAEGTATVFAYYKWNDTMVRSNYVEVTVAGEFEGEGSGSGNEGDQEPVVTYELNPAFQIVRGNDNHSYDADSIEIISESGDLYQKDNTLSNLFLYTPDVDKANLRASVKVEGLPINESGKWDTASFILFSGEDDYYTIGKKSHYQGFATVKERAQSAVEENGNSAHNAVETAWLGIVKEGDTIKLEYSLDGTTWETAKTFTDATFGNEYQLGFGTWTSTNTARKATFSEFKVGTADQSYADLKAVEILTVASETTPEPDVSDVFVAFGTDVVFEENDAEEVTVSIPEEIQKIEMTYAFTEGDVKISQNGTELAGKYKNAGSVMLDVADGDKIVITNAGKSYTFTIKCVASDETTVDKITIAALGFEVNPSDEKSFFLGETYKKNGTIEVTVAENVGTVKVLDRHLRTEMDVKKDGNVYSVDYVLVDGENTFYVQSIAKDGITKQQYALTMVYDVPTAPSVRLNDTVADDLKVGGVVTEVYVTGVEETDGYTYALCEGGGDTHNDFFEIVDGTLKVKKALTHGEAYSIRVKATAGETVLEASFTVRAEDPTRTPDYDGNDLPTEGMKLTAGTLETTEGSLEALFDGDPDSFYHSNWSGVRPTDADFWLIVELPELTNVSGIRYLPRQSSPNGRILAYEISYSVDGENWSEPVAGNWADDNAWKVAEFGENVEAKYVKLFATDSKADNSGRHMTGAELRVLKAIEEETPVDPPVAEEEVLRLFGDSRYDTGYAVADALKEALGVEKFEAVVVATGKNFADALAGSYLAVEKNAPILLTNGKDDNITELHAYIAANVAEGGKVYILGGEGAVPTAVDVIDGYEVERLFGESRYDTNLAILEEAGVTGDSIIVATGKNFADSLSASAAKLPILLVKPDGTLNDAQKDILAGMKNIYIVGGDGAVSADYEAELAAFGTVTRVFGESRYDTSVEVAKTFCKDVDFAVVASGKNFPDGLCGGPLSAALNAPLVLTKDGGADAAAAYVAENGIASGYVLGGDGALADETVVEVFALESADEILVKE